MEAFCYFFSLFCSLSLFLFFTLDQISLNIQKKERVEEAQCLNSQTSLAEFEMLYRLCFRH